MHLQCKGPLITHDLKTAFACLSYTQFHLYKGRRWHLQQTFIIRNFLNPVKLKMHEGMLDKKKTKTKTLGQEKLVL